MSTGKTTKERFAVILLSFLIIYTFLLGGLVYNYSPKQGPLVPFYPKEEGLGGVESHPVLMSSCDLNGRGGDDIVVAWDNGNITIYMDGGVLETSVPTNDIIVGVFAYEDFLYAVGTSGNVYLFQWVEQRIEKIGIRYLPPGIADCEALELTNDSVTIAYTIPQTSILGLAEISPSQVYILSEIQTEIPGCNIDYLKMNDGNYIVVSSLLGQGGMILYPYSNGMLGSGIYVDTSTRVTSVCSGFFFSDINETIAAINYNRNNISFYEIGQHALSARYLWSINTYSGPYKGMVIDLNGDGLDELAVLAFRDNFLELLYPAINATITYPVGRSPVDIGLYHPSSQGSYIYVLNKYSNDISYISIDTPINGPFVIGGAVLKGVLHHLKANSTTYVLYSTQSPSGLILKSLDPFNPYEATIYEGDGDIDFAIMNTSIPNSPIIVVSDSKAENISVLHVCLTSKNVHVLAQANITAVQNITAITVGDMDNDGLKDIVYVAYAKPRCIIGIIFNKGGEWHNQSYNALVFRPLDVMLDDVDVDGTLDVIAVDINGFYYVFYGNEGGGLVTDNAMPVSTYGG